MTTGLVEVWTASGRDHIRCIDPLRLLALDFDLEAMASKLPVDINPRHLVALDSLMPLDPYSNCAADVCGSF